MNVKIALTQYTETFQETIKEVPFTEHILPLPGFFVETGKRLCADTEGLKGIEYQVSVRAEEDVKSISLALVFESSTNTRRCHFMIPAAVYDGNRFEILRQHYPPMFHKEHFGDKQEPVITDVPHLGKEGGVISLRAGDSAVPAVCLFDPLKRTGTVLLYPCVPGGKGNYEAGCVIREFWEDNGAKCRISLMNPIVRSSGMYRFGNIRSDAPCKDRPANLMKGENLRMKVQVYTFPCEDILTLYRHFWILSRQEKRIAGDYTTPHVLPLSRTYQLIQEKYHTYNWLESEGFYCVGENTGRYSCWQTGWVGGVNAVWPLYLRGDGKAVKRALSTMDYLFSHMQTDSGFFYGNYCDGEIFGDSFHEAKNRGFVLTRKNADALYFAALLALTQSKRTQAVSYEEGLRRSAEAFNWLFDKNGQFGQFIDAETGAILVGGSASGAMAIGALAYCAVHFEDRRYLETARRAAEYYHRSYVAKGIANGGPGEILSAPDSESAYALLESFTVLYEHTREEIYLRYAKDAACLYATWCMSYDYPFPAKSQFGLNNIRTTGAVWANIQNKHGAPGVCTHSGSALFRLYLYTGEERYFNLCRDTSHNITQYVARSDRPLLDYDGNPVLDGFMCERVSTSDWEGFDKIGGIYGSGCWCEATAMSVYADIPGVYVNFRTRMVKCIDHVTAELKENETGRWVLNIKNPTRYQTETLILIDGGDTAYPDYLELLQTVKIEPGGEVFLLI